MEGQRMKFITLAIVVAVTALCAGGAMAQSSCTNAIISMSPCLNYISGNSSTPSSSCCSQLASVVRSQPQCLCQVLNGGAASSLGVTINQTLALQLPSACNVRTPSISGCTTGAASGPAGSSAEIPDSPSATGSKTNSPSTTGSNTDTPSESTDNNGTSDGFSIKSSFSLLCFLLFSVSYASTFTTV